MPRQRNYRAEYEARKLRAQSEGFSGYGQARHFRDKQLADILSNDPIFGGLPEAQRTRANAIRYRQGFLYTGRGTAKQRAIRTKLLKDLEGNLDTGVWSDYYKDVIYPQLTGQPFPNWNPTVITSRPVTQDEWDEIMRADTLDTEEGE